jgi:hypothetical protein
MTLSKLIGCLFFITYLLLITSCNSGDSVVIEPSVLAEDINSDRTLQNINEDPAAVDYIVTKENLNVNAKLTIEGGVTIAFEANTSLRFPYTGTGSLAAIGTESSPIIFTGKVKTPGFWKGILIATASVENMMQYCTVEYAGGGILHSSGNPVCNLLIAKVATSVGKLNVGHCTFQHSKGMGVAVTESAQLLSFIANSFISNELAPMQVPPSMVHMIDATSAFSNGNRYNGVEILGGELDDVVDRKWNKLSNASSYHILGNFAAITGLVVEAGTVLDMSAGSLFRASSPKGYIKAVGNNSDKVVFQGLNNVKGSWKGILFASADSRNELTHCIVKDAGGGSLYTGLPNANVGVVTQTGHIGKLTIANSNLENSAGCGLSFAANTMVTQNALVFLENVGANICN